MLYCKSNCIKTGLQKSGVQNFFCKMCKRYHSSHVRNGWRYGIDKKISQFMVEGIGVRSTARILKIAVSTVHEKFKLVRDKITRPFQWAKDRNYEIDEVWTYGGTLLIGFGIYGLLDAAGTFDGIKESWVEGQ